jgi:cytochrome P450
VLDLHSEDMRRDPYPVYDQLRAASPVLHDPRSDFWMVFDYEGVRRALTDPDAFSSRAAPPGGKALDLMIFFDPPRHTKLRALIARAFTPRSVADLEPRIRGLSRELLDAVVERGEADLVVDYAVPLPLLVIAEMLGIPAADRPRFRGWVDVMVGLIYTVTGGDAGARAVQAFGAATREMADYLDELVARRRAEPQDDLLTRLAAAEVDGERLTAKEILNFFQLLLLAGSETTTNLIGNAVLCLTENPDQLVRLREAPELLPTAIEEVLRYRSPLQAAFRQTRADVTMHGQTIRAGKLVLAMIGSANRDLRQFAAADRFDIGRDPNSHVAFGHGIHFCLGAPLARLEAKIALPDLLGRLNGLALAGDGPWEPRQAFHVHGPGRLPVRFEPGPRATRRES